MYIYTVLFNKIFSSLLLHYKAIRDTFMICESDKVHQVILTGDYINHYVVSKPQGNSSCNFLRCCFLSKSYITVSGFSTKRYLD